MTEPTRSAPASGNSLGVAIVHSSSTPLVVLDARLGVYAASTTFCQTFGCDPETVRGTELFALSEGKWDIAELRGLLIETLESGKPVAAHPMDFGHGDALRHLMVNAQRLDYGEADGTLLLLAVDDVTAMRLGEQHNRDLVEEKQVLLQELQHRVANSLQIIASVLIQSARKVQSEEARIHLNDAHHRVMAIATLQKQLAASGDGHVALRPYLTKLCATIGEAMIADNERVTITTDIADASSTSDASVSLGLIATELIINALKHAFPDDVEDGEVALVYTTDGLSWLLTITDNGVGRPLQTIPGLGTGIVEALSRQLQARVETRDARPGTMVRISRSALGQ